jgi:hypothetical protein
VGIGERIETGLFMSLAFYGTMPNDVLLKLAGFYYSFKVLYALCAMPLVTLFVKFLKEKEGIKQCA